MAKGKYNNWLTRDGLLLIEGWAREGLTDEQIAHNMGISKTTFYDYKLKSPDISEALKKGKAPVDFEVENQLLKSALGYTVTVKEPIKLKKRRQKPGVGLVEEDVIEYAEREIYIKPEITAQIYWLNNRKPDKWRNKREYEQKLADNDPLIKLLEGLNKQAEENAGTNE